MPYPEVTHLLCREEVTALLSGRADRLLFYLRATAGPETELGDLTTVDVLAALNGWNNEFWTGTRAIPGGATVHTGDWSRGSGA